MSKQTGKYFNLCKPIQITKVSCVESSSLMNVCMGQTVSRNTVEVVCFISLEVGKIPPLIRYHAICVSWFTNEDPIRNL